MYDFKKISMLQVKYKIKKIDSWDTHWRIYCKSKKKVKAGI